MGDSVVGVLVVGSLVDGWLVVGSLVVGSFVVGSFVGLCVGLNVGLRVVGLEIVACFGVVGFDEGLRVIGSVVVGKLVILIRNQLSSNRHRWP